jgi:hypothetical protein
MATNLTKFHQSYRSSFAIAAVDNTGVSQFDSGATIPRRVYVPRFLEGLGKMRSWENAPPHVRIIVIVGIGAGLSLLAWMYVTVQHAF